MRVYTTIFATTVSKVRLTSLALRAHAEHVWQIWLTEGLNVRQNVKHDLTDCLSSA